MPTDSDLRQSIEACNRQFMDALERRDAGAVAALYTADAEILAPNSDFVRGTDAVRRFWQAAIDAGMRSELEVLSVERHGDIVVELGRYALLREDGWVADVGKYLVVWKKAGRTWQLHLDVWNTSRASP